MSFVFDLEPVGKPRIVRSDTWSPRPQVCKYYLFKDKLNIEAIRQQYRLSDELNMVFHMPMPESWSKKKRNIMNGMPCKSKPDIDNLVKAFLDALTTDDKSIYSIYAKKVWSEKGSIIVNSKRPDS